MTRQIAVFSVLIVATVLAGCSKKEGAGSTGLSGAVARLAEVRGTVTVNGKPARPGVNLAAGDQVFVSEGGLARVERPDKTRFLLVGLTAAGTEWSAGPARGEGGLEVMLVRLSKGLLSFIVPREARATGRYEIEAESSLTVVRGTEGKVQTGPSGDTVSVKQGSVEVRNKASGQVVSLTTGQLVTVGPGADIGTPAPYDFSTAAEQQLYDVGPILMKTLGSQ